MNVNLGVCNVNHFAGNADSAADRCASDVALQQGVGILSEWRLGIDRTHPAGAGVDWTSLDLWRHWNLGEKQLATFACRTTP